LLLVVAVAIAAVITKSMVNRNPEEPGFVIGAWNRIIQAIGSDLADEPTIREQQQ
jgi:hypothetical protein